MICRRTMQQCLTPSMCAPFRGCLPPDTQVKPDLELRIARLERIVERLCPDRAAARKPS